MTSETVGTVEKAAAGGSVRSRILFGLWAAGLAALVGAAYRDLLVFDAASSIPEELQTWLMLPSQTSSALIAVLAVWLLFRRVPRLRALPDRAGPAWLTALLLAGALGIYAWATYTAAADLQVFSLMLNALALGNLLWGRAGLRVLALPVGFLIFALPLPGPLLNEVVYRFQLWTAELAGVLLYLIGQPAYVSGDQVLRDGDLFSIIEGCSGLRSVETLTMLALLMADLFRRRGRHVAVLLLAAPPIAFLLNSVRVVFLILNPLSETAIVHSAQGIAILLGGLLLLFALDGMLGRALRSPAPGRAAGSARWPGLSPARAGLPALALLAALGVSLWLPPWERPPGAPSVGALLASPLPGWRETNVPTQDYQRFLGRVGFANLVERGYQRGRDHVDLFLGVTDHRDRQRSAWSGKTAVPGTGWIVEERGVAALGPARHPVEYRIVRSGRRRALVYHWREGMGSLAEETLRSLLALDQSPLRRERHAFVARATTEMGAPSPANRRAAEERLESFGETIAGALVPAGSQGKEFPTFPGS